MPYITNWPPRRIIALAAASVSLMMAASPASAFAWGGTSYQEYQPSAPSGSCTIPASSPVLSPLGDLASYALMPGASFEGSTDGWALNGASVVPGNEPWYVGGSSDSHSLSIPAGAYAVSPTFCLNSQLPRWRFFAKSADGNWGTTLTVTAVWADSFGNSGQMQATSLYGGGFTSWQPTSSLPLGSVMLPGDTANVRFVFSAASNGGAWNLDDVYIDPYAR